MSVSVPESSEDSRSSETDPSEKLVDVRVIVADPVVVDVANILPVVVVFEQLTAIIIDL